MGTAVALVGPIVKQLGHGLAQDFEELLVGQGFGFGHKVLPDLCEVRCAGIQVRAQMASQPLLGWQARRLVTIGIPESMAPVYNPSENPVGVPRIP